MPKEQLVGLSLSFCVGDILRGRVAEDQVVKIITSTACENLNHWARTLQKYAEHYWDSDPERGCDIAWRFIDEGKVEQPRLQGKPYPHILEGHWQTLEGEQVQLQ